MPHITTCTTCGKLYEEFSEESASAPNERECGSCWIKREDAEHEARELIDADSTREPGQIPEGLEAPKPVCPVRSGAK